MKTQMNAGRACCLSLTSPSQMETRWKLPLLWLALLTGACAVQAQTYSIDWYKISGGGGTSTGAVYSVSGTIGQHDAGVPLTGGNYSLTGGFWALAAVQTPGAPTLRIFLTSTNTAVVAWPAPATGWSLQVSPNLATASWGAAGGSVNVVGGENQVIVSPSAGNRFYRLHNP